MVGGSRSTRREPAHVLEEHANSTQQGPSHDSNQKSSCCEATALTNTPALTFYCFVKNICSSWIWWQQPETKRLGHQPLPAVWTFHQMKTFALWWNARHNKEDAGLAARILNRTTSDNSMVWYASITDPTTGFLSSQTFTDCCQKKMPHRDEHDPVSSKIDVIYSIPSFCLGFWLFLS